MCANLPVAFRLQACVGDELTQKQVRVRVVIRVRLCGVQHLRHALTPSLALRVRANVAPAGRCTCQCALRLALSP